MAEARLITQITNPLYDPIELGKYRLTYTGGQSFIEIALKQYANERSDTWKLRRDLAYNPAFAEEAVNEYVHAILQYQNDVERVGGSPRYLDICGGGEQGVDGHGSSMNSFVGRYVISELLVMGRVGIYVDNFRFMGNTLADVIGHPYMYVYKAENILNWSFYQDGRLRALLLRDFVEEIDPISQLPYELTEQYRHIYINAEGNCQVDFYDNKARLQQSIPLQLKTIPFVFLEIPSSLLKNVCDYQAALTNLASSTFYYAWGANFPLYTEQYNPMDQDRFFEGRQNDNPPNPDLEEVPTSDVEYSEATDTPNKKEDAARIYVGPLTGRRYAKGTERPGFINPSSEPLTASMNKEAQLKEEIRQLVALNVSSLSPKMASAESKALDREGLEGGLNSIGLTLENMENRVAKIWHTYLNGAKDITRITYPERYTLRTDESRRLETKELMAIQHAVPSKTFRQHVSKKIANVMFGISATQTNLTKMYSEIDAAKVPTADPDVLRSDHEAGFVSTTTASEGRGYLPGEAEKAKQDAAERLARIAEAQSSPDGTLKNPGARGVGDADSAPGDAADAEKEGKAGRGEEDSLHTGANAEED
jgi:hypothetical protein